MEDKTLVCKDCGNEFVFTTGEQEFYKEKGFENEPVRCPDCRRARKQQNKTDIEIIKKINRDLYSGQRIYKDNNIINVAYGYLHISYDRKLNIINNINNKYRSKKCGRINQEIRAELNKIYEIEED